MSQTWAARFALRKRTTKRMTTGEEMEIKSPSNKRGPALLNAGSGTAWATGKLGQGTHGKKMHDKWWRGGSTSMLRLLWPSCYILVSSAATSNMLLVCAAKKRRHPAIMESLGVKREQASVSHQPPWLKAKHGLMWANLLVVAHQPRLESAQRGRAMGSASSNAKAIFKLLETLFQPPNLVGT
ncbi:hypothetical protein J3F84DRAFT_244153 [Trichoderma pleuroticola]